MTKILVAGLVAILATAGKAAIAQRQSDYFTTSRDTIEVLDSARITWHISGVSTVFISGIGEVPSVGLANVSPIFSRKYELIYQKDTNWVSKTVSIVVRGRRGAEEFPDKKLFSYQNTLELPSSNLSIDQFFNKILLFFQDAGFIVELDNNLREGSKFTIRTKWAKSPRLLQSDDTFQKWVAYQIDFQRFDIKDYSLDKGLISFNKPTVLQCVIQPVVEYNRLLIPDVKFMIYSNDPHYGGDYLQAAINLKRIIYNLR